MSSPIPIDFEASGESTIGIVGAGRIGRALARHAARADLRVLICHRGAPEQLAAFAASAGGAIIPATLGEATDPEVVVIAIPHREVDGAFAEIADWEARIVIDATNPAAGDAPAPMTSSEVVAGMLPGAHVVKAFNALPAAVLEDDPVSANGRRVIFHAGDHARAKVVVARLIGLLGFAAVDLGTLGTGGRLIQPPDGPLAGLTLVKAG